MDRRKTKLGIYVLQMQALYISMDPYLFPQIISLSVATAHLAIVSLL